MFAVVNRLGAGLSGASLRQTVLSNNLANANTPGFKRSDVSFASQLRGHNPSRFSVRQTQPGHQTGRSRPSPSSLMQRDTSTLMRNDDNNVDVDREMVYIMENQLHYQAMADTANRHLQMLRSAISEGGR